MRQDRIFYRILPICGLAGLLAGCASTEPYSAMPVPRSLGSEFARTEPTAMPGPAVAVPDVIRMKDALILALQGNPELTAFSYEVRAAEARVLQAGTLPNPEIGVELDEYDRADKGFDSAETAIVLGQVFELGGKRRWRTRIAEAQGELAGWDYESKRLDVFTETARRFTGVIAAQQRLEILISAVDLAAETNRAVTEQVMVGKETPLQAAKSEAELELARLDLQKAQNTLQKARRDLALMWGAERAGFYAVEGTLDPVLQVIPPLEELRAYLTNNPDLARWEAELRLRRATLSSVKAQRIPDVEGSVGYVQFEEDGTDGLAFSVGFPLPVFDRNQGNIVAARHDLAKAEAERSAIEVSLVAELAAAYDDLSLSNQRIATLRNKVIPAMEQTFQAAHEGYQQGKLGFLDMLDAQRGLFEVRGAFVDALSAYQAALIDLQRLTATRIGSLIN